VTSLLRDRLAELLAADLDRHHLVVWQDSDAEYAEVAEAVVPHGVAFARFEGSWIELRHNIEGDLALADPPKLVVYVAVAAPERDPLAELRAAAHRFAVPLRELIHEALATNLAGSQIEAIAETARTFSQAEEAASSGVAPSLVPLVLLLGAGLTDVAMLVAVLGGTRDQALDSKGAWGDVHHLVERTLGITTTETQQAFREVVARVLLLEAVDRAGVLPERLRTALPNGNEEQCGARLRLVDDWWASRPETAVEAFAAADKVAVLTGDTAWSDGLVGVDIAPGLEAVAASHMLDLLNTGQADKAVKLAETRAAGRWVRFATLAPALNDEWASRWRVLLALAELRRELSRHSPPPTTDSGATLAWYAADGWRVDRAHRRLELALTGLAEQGDLENPVTAARVAYEDWLARVIERYTTAIADGGFSTGKLLRQAEVFPRYVKSGDKLTAYIWVDAFRFELATDVADSLRAAGNEVELIAAIAAAPTITPVGMANLCPGADESLNVDEDGGSLVVRVGGVPVPGPDARRSLLRGAMGEVAAFELSTCVLAGEQALAKDIAGSKVVLITSVELDAGGEHGVGMLSTAWSTFADTQATLPRVVAKLAKAGVRRVVITADHGFISLSRRLGDAYKIDAPKGGRGELHRRAWVGRGGVDHPSVLRVPLASTGVVSDLDILVPRGLALFKAGGSKQFFHGGLSPQELVIPVVVAELAVPSDMGLIKFDVDVVGHSISTAMFAATVRFNGNLFTNSVVVRAIARRGKDLVVAQVVKGDGFDASSGTVTVPASNEVRLMFQVTKALDPKDKVEVQVLDARTDAVLGKATVPVAAPVSTFDDDLED
jgi:hypothetical protein